MESTENRMWGIHTYDDSLFINHSIIAIGWSEMGDLSKFEPNRESFKQYYPKVYTDAKKVLYHLIPVSYIDLCMKLRSETI